MPFSTRSNNLGWMKRTNDCIESLEWVVQDTASFLSVSEVTSFSKF